MARKKTYSEKEYEIKAYHQQKRHNLSIRLSMKYDKKKQEEYDKKVKAINRNEERKLHNLEVEYGKKKGNAKIRKKKATKKGAKNYARQWFSKYIRIKLARKVRNGYVSECYTCSKNVVVVYLHKDGKIIRPGEAHPGHMIKKGQGDSLKFYEPVFRIQCAECNILHAENQKDRENKWREEVGEKAYGVAIAIKGMSFDMSIDDIRKLKDKCKAYVEAKLEELITDGYHG